ncbi:MAG: sensor of ECF-type sigma factor [Bacteroidetes bacterium]|nr:MAG: sensor of ECF-type sigma factor [Bacteroidota bacterium]
MKQIVLYITIFLISASSLAQQNNSKIKALKIAFITERLNLTETEAQKFWPIYNTFDKNTSKIKREEITKIRQEIRQNIGDLSDAKANELLDRFIKAENELHKEKTQLLSKLRKVISAQKIILLKVAEDEFNRRMLERMKNMRQRRINKNKP